MLRRPLAPIVLLLLTGCGGPATTIDPPLIDSTRGTIIGVVSTIGEEGELHIIRGARVSAHGIEAVSDALGRFVIDGVPTDTPISVTVNGPASKVGDRAERYAENRIILTVPSRSRLITPDVPLLSACRFDFDGSTGATTACSTDDRASFVFPAGAVDAEHVIAHVAALDPIQIVDRLAFPQGKSDESVAILGGVDVELVDENGAALQIAAGKSATVRFELAPTDTPESELALQWFDRASGDWVEQPRGRVVREGARSFYEFEAQHFSSYRAVSDVQLSPNACITFTPRICEQAGCERAIFVSAVDFGGYRTVRGTYGPEDACIPAHSGRHYNLYGRWIDPTTPLNPNAPMYFLRTNVGLPASQASGYECTAGCTAIQLPLREVRPGCVTGTFTTACGLGCVEPYSGQLDVLIDRQRIASVEVPAECGGDVCVPVAFVTAGEIVDLETTSGHKLSFSPDIASRGEACGASACAPSPGCEALGTVMLACGEGLGVCLEAEFTSDVVLDDPECASTPTTPHAVRVDARLTTIGLAVRYVWRIFAGDALVLERRDPDGTAKFCLAAGAYRITLTAESSRNLHLPVYDTVSHDVGVGTFSIIATPDATVPAGMPVTLTVVTPDDPSQYTFVWSRVRLGDPSRVGEGVSVTFTPSAARDTYRVEAFIDTILAGSAEIVIEAGALDPLPVMIHASDLAPRDGQPVNYAATALDLDAGMERPVSCVYEGLINAVHWVVHRPEGDEPIDFDAPPGMALECSSALMDPWSITGALPAGDYSLDLMVISLDGRVGMVQHVFTVYP